jgi:hypothetical protein
MGSTVSSAFRNSVKSSSAATELSESADIVVDLPNLSKLRIEKPQKTPKIDKDRRRFIDGVLPDRDPCTTEDLERIFRRLTIISFSLKERPLIYDKIVAMCRLSGSANNDILDEEDWTFDITKLRDVLYKAAEGGGTGIFWNQLSRSISFAFLNNLRVFGPISESHFHEESERASVGSSSSRTRQSPVRRALTGGAWPDFYDSDRPRYSNDGSGFRGGGKDSKSALDRYRKARIEASRPLPVGGLGNLRRK